MYINTKTYVDMGPWMLHFPAGPSENRSARQVQWLSQHCNAPSTRLTNLVLKHNVAQLSNERQQHCCDSTLVLY